jgi:hypothetical protein
MDKRVINMLGRRCHHLVVMAHAGSIVKGEVGRASHTAIWKCRCDCGVEVVVTGWSLRSGHTRSCGCGIAAANKRRRRKP